MAAPVKFLMVIQLMFFLQLFCFTNGVKQKHVSISLNAKWRSTPMLLEASEFVAKESEEKFWNFIEDFSELSEQDVDTYTDEAFYKLIQKFAARFLSQMQVELLRFALSLRAYSPRVAMYNQIAKDYKDQFGVCEAFVDIHGEMTCDPEKVEQLVDSAATRPKSTTFKFDHSFPGSHSNEVTVILFAEVGRKTFTEFHSKLKTLAGQGQVQYIFRHYIQSPPDNNVRLAGYGIELAIKSTEYKAKDDTKVEDGGKSDDDDDNDQDEDIQGFVFSTLKKLHPDSTEDLMKFKTHLVDSSTEVEPLKVWQFQDLSFQTAQRVLSASSDDALKVLTDIIQNFPVKTRSLVNVQVDSKVKQEIQKNQKHMQSTLEVGNGESALFVNGWQIDLEVMDMFLLLDLMGSEAKLIDGLHAIGVQGEALTKMLSLDLKDSEEYVLDFRHDSVIWINDLENDQKYSRWPDQVEDLLRPTWPGMMRHVAKNFFHLVLYVNPADPSSIPLLKMVESFYVHNAPVRIGIVLIATSGEEVDYTQDVSVALYRAFHFIEDAHTAYKAVSFLTDVYDRADGGDITPELVVTVFKEKFSSLGSSVDTILGSSTEYDEQREETIEYFEGTGLGELPQALINGLPIKKSVLNAEDFEENVVSTIMQVTPPVQRDVYHGKIHDRMNILDYLMGQDNALSRLNSRVLSAATNATYLSFTEESAGTLNIEPEADMSNDEVTARISVNMKYLAKKEEDSVRPLTVWLVGDLTTEDGRSLLYAAIKNLRSTGDMRLGFVHNPKTVSENKDDYLIPLAIQAAFQSQPMNLAKLFITKLLKEENVAALTDKSKTLSDLEVNGMDMAVYLKALEEQDLNFLRWGQTFSQRVLRFRPGNRGIISNGRVLGPLRPDESFLTEDFNLLDQYAVKKSAGKVRDTLRSSKLKPNEASDLIMKVCALLESQVSGESAGRKSVSFPSEKYSVVNLPGKSDQPAHDIVAILDPLTRAAQKLVPLLMVLKEVTNSNLKVVFNCKDKLSEMPLKSFYRLVLEPEPQFRVDGSLSSGPSARFTNLPQKPILTLNMDSPDSWMVEVVRAAYDLDNIVMEEVETGVNAEFELEHILLEGHCYDSSSGQPPRGLQFTLGTSTNPAMVDTIVMANLGYFQLKANPGAWLLDLRDGRSAEFYDISSHDNTESTTNDRPLTVVIDSFRGKTVKIQVKKKPEKANEDLLGEEDESKSMWDSLSSTFTGGDEAKEDKDETLNIFSLASGHLYERFLRIMMLSVIKNSQSKVKFWFLKNYLSPSFKDFIPHYAKKYGFEYELVQYKWPRWLHQQTEKQRMIWGYKILFLDVLFPLHVKKIIFVDADQTVRADLQELYDLDLGGAPYGYTPFCDSREDMDGFSALYVVDLKKFRRIAAGDRLRGQYQGLSQDPNSLSNLDQDLPNNMIHQVSIKSLPQEWLWCETWCDDRSKKKAKTIDLCNNPKTKEPKLQAAERIVGEWKDYDNEIKQLWETFHQTSSTKSAQTTETSTEKRDEL